MPTNDALRSFSDRLEAQREELRRAREGYDAAGLLLAKAEAAFAEADAAYRKVKAAKAAESRPELDLHSALVNRRPAAEPRDDDDLDQQGS